MLHGISIIEDHYSERLYKSAFNSLSAVFEKTRTRKLKNYCRKITCRKKYIKILKPNVRENRSKFDSASGDGLLKTLVEGHLDQLKKNTELIGGKLYYLKPKAFVGLLESALDSYSPELE